MNELNGKKIIEIHYNAFQSIKEQIKDYKCKDIEIFEKARIYIFYLYIQGFITDSEKNKACNRLHKKIINAIIKENNL